MGIPADACVVFPLPLAQTIEPTLRQSGLHDGGPSEGIAECDYQVQTSSSHGEDLTFEIVDPTIADATPVPIPAIANGYNDPSQYLSHRSEPVADLGDDAIFVYATCNGGGSEQGVHWVSNGVSADLNYDSAGPGGLTQDRSAALIAAARAIAHQLG